MRGDRPLTKSKSAVIYLDAAANICADYPDIKFGFTAVTLLMLRSGWSMVRLILPYV